MKMLSCPSFDGYPVPVEFYVPRESTGPLPLVVLFFGGSWTYQNMPQFRPHARELNRLGVAVAIPDYRVYSVQGTTADVALRDAMAAVSFLYDRAADLGVDPEKIVLGGASSGGHLAAGCLTLPEFLPEDAAYPGHIRGLFLLNPALDPEGEMCPAISASPVSPDRLSPLRQLSAPLPETRILHGTADRVVPFAQSQAFAEKAADLGTPVRLLPYEGAPHAFYNLTPTQIHSYYRVLADLVQFLFDLHLITL